MSSTAAGSFAETICLRSDNGSEYSFRGRMFAESSSYDDESASLMRLRLFLSEDGAHVYSIVSGTSTEKSSRYYVVQREGDMCRMNDGRQVLVVPVELLFSAVFGLCGIDPAQAESLRPVVEDALHAAGA